MTYSELLGEYIERSGFTLGEIALKMNEFGIKIDRSYISMLKNNKTKNPASDEINRALAQVTGGDPEQLLYAAYVEKAPEEMKKHLERVGDVDLVLTRLLNQYTKHLFENNLLDLNDESEIMKSILSGAINDYDTLTLDEKMDVLEFLVMDAKDRSLSASKIYESSFPKASDEEEKESYKEFLSSILPVMSVEPNKFYPALQKEIRDFTKLNKGPMKLVTTPNNIIYLYSELINEYGEFKDKLFNLLLNAHSRYLSAGFKSPGFNPNVIVELDIWLSKGYLTYKKLPLTDNDKELISIYIEALLSDRLKDKTINKKD